MSDVNYSHEFQPNRKGLCTQIIGGRKTGYTICHLPEDASAHEKWRLAHLEETILKERKEMDKAKLLSILERIAQDMKDDAAMFDGKPFNGKTVGEYFGCHGAAIATLADIIKVIIKQVEEGEK
jgi:hypothetical protein